MKHKLLTLTCFTIAMALLESIVVVYLRELFYPKGFDFPLVNIPQRLIFVEILREFSTIVMLFTLASLLGTNFTHRVAYFLYSFGVWDIFYYVFLYILLSWPSSIHTWDLLFLIPYPWTSPVYAPILISISFIFFALLIFWVNKKFRFVHYIWLLASFMLIFYSLTYDYLNYILQYVNYIDLFKITKYNYLAELTGYYVPKNFNLLLFFSGVLLLYSLIWFYWWYKK